jgi:hypothetical protein
VGTLMTANGGIKIAENGDADADAPADDMMAADMEMARRLQAQMDAQAYASGGGNRCAPRMRLPAARRPCASCMRPP